MRTSTTVAVLALCGISCVAWAAKIPQNPAPAPVNLHFNAPAGKYQHVFRATPCAATQFHSRIVIDQAYLDPQGVWGPAVQIFANPQSVQSGNVASLLIVPEGRDVRVELRKFSHDVAVENILYSSAKRLGKGIDTTISWTQLGVLSITLDGGEKHSVTLGEPVRLMKFTVSGAKADFDAVQFDAPDVPGPCAKPRSHI